MKNPFETMLAERGFKFEPNNEYHHLHGYWRKGELVVSVVNGIAELNDGTTIFRRNHVPALATLIANHPNNH